MLREFPKYSVKHVFEVLKKHLNKTVLLSTQDICLGCEKKNTLFSKGLSPSIVLAKAGLQKLLTLLKLENTIFKHKR